MASSRSQNLRRAQGALLWTVLFFGLFQLSGGVCVEHWLPDARDPEFAGKLVRLQKQRQQAPQSPLVLMLGSSRTSLGFKAGAVNACHLGKPIVAFNFGISGGGPILQLLCLRRLLNAGIRPELLLVEILPAMLNQPGRHPLEEQWLQGSRMRLSEIWRLEVLHTDPSRLFRRWCRGRLLPWPSLHRSLEAVLNPSWIEPPAGPGEGEIDEHGWEPHFLNGISEEQRRRLLEVARGQYHDSMGEFHMAEQPTQALRELLELCRRERLPLGLVIMPEGSEFRAMYPTEVVTGIDRFLGNLSREWNVPLIDARGWVPDGDLWDAHHPLPSGAAIFTARLQREAIIPLLRSQPLAKGFHEGGCPAAGGAMAYTSR